MTTDLASVSPRIAIAVLLLAVASLGTACLAKTGEEPDAAPPGELMTGQMRLEEFPVEAVGISGLGPYCRLVSSCGCPILSPDDIAWCRDDVTTYSEEFCLSILENQIPECLGE